jgi:hypothetical protein
MIQVPVSPGELLDKISILAIKLKRISDPAKRANVEREYRLLEDIRRREIPDAAGLSVQFDRLAGVNEQLWDVEDDLRDQEAAQQFHERFITLARAVYVLNDERAAIKKAINVLLGSAIVEEKSYANYRVRAGKSE